MDGPSRPIQNEQAVHARRDVEHDGTAVSRSRKRARYITRACNECKRRKIKCNGQTPCQGCAPREIECMYMPSPSDGVKQQPQNSGLSRDVQHLCAQIQTLQEQVTALSGTVASLNGQNIGPKTPLPLGHGTNTSILPVHGTREAGRSLSSPSWSFSSAKGASFQGPITSDFSFDIAKSRLRSCGITEIDEAITEGDVTQRASPMPSPLLSPRRFNTDPLWDISRQEARRLCHVYEEEMGMMYPVLSLGQTLAQIDLLYLPDASPSSQEGAALDERRRAILNSDQGAILKMVLACALTAQGGGRSELGLRLFKGVADIAERHVWTPPSIEGVLFLTLVAIFYFQMDEEALAWRTIGIVGRMCLEMGLHRRESLNKENVLQFGREQTVKLFWSVYVLDMRWSLGTGMRCSLQDIDIDPYLPEPDENTPYLRVMVGYSRIAAKVWNFVATFNNTNEIKRDEMAYLDWQILQWAKSIPNSLRLIDRQDGPGDVDVCSHGVRRLRSILYLRTGQMRILIYRPILHSAADMERNAAETDTVVEIAIDTIRHVAHLHKTSGIYRLQQVAFNWFLVSALAVLFLAAAQAPGQYSSRCKEAFYMALELVSSFSTQSYVAKRLWRSIRSLKLLAPKLGMQKSREAPSTEANGDPQLPAENLDDAAVTVSASSNLPQQQKSVDEFPLYSSQISQELMDWFEAVGDLENPLWLDTMQAASGTGVEPSKPMSNDEQRAFTSGEGLSSIMRDCF